MSGGASRRMGRDKVLLNYRGLAMAAWVAARVEEAAGKVSLVGGGEKYVHLGYPVLGEAYAGSGPLSGIEAALRQGGAEWSLVVACDMVGVQAEWLQELLAAAEREGRRAVYACRSDGRQEPLCAVYHEDCLPDVQSLLLEGGPTLAAAFLGEGLVDKVMLFVAPVLAGSGPLLVGPLAAPIGLGRLDARRLGADVLLTAYVHEP